jgi:hypothetical protein
MEGTLADGLRGHRSHMASLRSAMNDAGMPKVLDLPDAVPLYVREWMTRERAQGERP